MPVATRKMQTVRRDLKSCDGGYVELRQLSYDEMLERRDGGIKILMEQNANRNVDSRTSMQIANKWSNHFSFPRCIVDHNLTDENGVGLDFSKPEFVFKHLDPKVGAEIERYIDELNQDEEGDTNFTDAPVSSSPEENGKQEQSTD